MPIDQHLAPEQAGHPPLAADSLVAVAILEPPDLRVTFANLTHTAWFGWEVGTTPARSGGPAPPGAASSRARVVPAAEAAVVLTAAEQVLRTGEPVRLPEIWAGQHALQVTCAPIRDQSTIRGVSVVTVDLTGQVQERTRLETERRRLQAEHQRLSVLDEATAAVAVEVEARREFSALAESVVPGLADACAIYLIDDQPGPISRDRSVHATRLVCVTDPATRVTTPAPEVRLRISPARPLAQAINTGEAVLAVEPPDPTGWGEPWLTQLNPHSLVAVPIGDPVLAVISFAAVGNRPRYQESDFALMRQLTERVATVVGNTLRLQRTSEVALALQRGLLSDPPLVAGLAIRVRYRPAGPGLEVGGDWYDVFRLPDGGLALTVGDIVGHDLSAASTMGQLRSMVQTLACQPGAGPAWVLDALSRLTTHLQVGEFATVVHGQLNPPAAGSPATFTWANAGHPPALLIDPSDSSPRLLSSPAGPLLGLSGEPYQQATVTIPPGGVLLLYTDGLIEDPDRPGVDPLAELTATVAANLPADLDDLCDRLVTGAAARDDIALLAVRSAD